MRPLSDIFGLELPITENVAFEAMQLLTEVDDETGSYDRMELHVLRIGQDLVERAGLKGATIGVTVTKVVGKDGLVGVAPEKLVMSDGIARAASSLPDTDRIVNVRPLGDPKDSE